MKPHVGGSVAPVLAAAGAAAGIALLVHQRRQRADNPSAAARRDALIGYLRDHLMGADAATQTVEHLREHAAAAYHRHVFASLADQFKRERPVVEQLLRTLDAGPSSLKRAAGSVAGSALRAIAGGKQGDFALFLTLEGLQIGIQGKRCLWRALQNLGSDGSGSGQRTFIELEANADQQWQALDRLRLALVPRTFSLNREATSTSDIR